MIDNDKRKDLGYVPSDPDLNKRIKAFLDEEKNVAKSSEEKYEINKSFLSKVDGLDLLNQFEIEISLRKSLLKLRGIERIFIGKEKINLDSLPGNLSEKQRSYLNVALFNEYQKVLEEVFIYEN